MRRPFVLLPDDLNAALMRAVRAGVKEAVREELTHVVGVVSS